MANSLKMWAAGEVKKAAERDRGGYYEGCLKSAYRVYKKLLKEGHSGLSIQITARLLKRLIDGKPLTPIGPEDFPKANGEPCIQCPRYSSLFKSIDIRGEITYTDINRVSCHDINTGSVYSYSLVTDAVNKMFPIKLPYYPADAPILAYCEDLLTDPKNGDFDTFRIIYLLKDGEKIEINKYYSLAGPEPEEITAMEYKERKLKARGK